MLIWPRNIKSATRISSSISGKLTARKLSDDPKLIRKLSDDPKLMETLGLIVEENENPKPNVGRVLSDEEKAAIAARNAILTKKTLIEPDGCPKKEVPKLKVTQSSFELGKLHVELNHT